MYFVLSFAMGAIHKNVTISLFKEGFCTENEISP